MMLFDVLTLLTLALTAIPMTWMMLVPVNVDLEALAQLENVSAVPMLLDALNINVTGRHRKRVTCALTTLLPLLKASDVNLLTPRHRHTLNILLASNSSSLLRGVDAGFTLAVLKAYEQVGDAKAIPVVKRLANSRPRNNRQREIQAAAAECLPLLRANVGEVTSTQTLLRASTRHANTPDTLLRPPLPRRLYLLPNSSALRKPTIRHPPDSDLLHYDVQQSASNIDNRERLRYNEHHNTRFSRAGEHKGKSYADGRTQTKPLACHTRRLDCLLCRVACCFSAHIFSAASIYDARLFGCQRSGEFGVSNARTRGFYFANVIFGGLHGRHYWERYLSQSAWRSLCPLVCHNSNFIFHGLHCSGRLVSENRSN